MGDINLTDLWSSIRDKNTSITTLRTNLTNEIISVNNKQNQIKANINLINNIRTIKLANNEELNSSELETEKNLLEQNVILNNQINVHKNNIQIYRTTIAEKRNDINQTINILENNAIEDSPLLPTPQSTFITDNLMVRNYVNISGNLDISGNINFKGTLLQNGNPFQNEQGVSSGDSVWNVSGSDIYLDNSYNVGIGKAEPTEALDVSGNVIISGTLNTGLIIEDGVLLSEKYAPISGSSSESVWNVSGSNVYLDNSYNVGIGNTNPLYKLDVSGSIVENKVLLKNKYNTINKNILAENAVSTWTARTTATNTTYNIRLCWAPELGIFCAVASDGGTAADRVMTSSDGINWTTRDAVNDNAWTSICWAPELGLFCAVAEWRGSVSNRIMTSPDGINWTARVAPNDNYWYSVCWAPELSLFCAVAYGSETEPETVMTSPDGINWTARTAANNNWWYSVCWAPELGLFCAVAGEDGPAANKVMTSPDGINWTTREAANANAWFSVCWAPELKLFCAISASGGSTGNSVMTSPDGINWTARAAANNNNGWYNVCWAPELGLFCAVAGQDGLVGDRIMTSPDGINWTARAAPNTNNNGWWSICWAPELGIFCSTANFGSAMTSTYTVPWRTRGNNIIQNGTSNVGIGKTEPTQALDVSGNIVASGSITPFTGSHRVSATLSEKDIGKLVSSSGNIPTIEINNAWPEVELSHIDNDIKVFGIITNSSASYNLVNSVGEGSLWVCDKNGNISTGDLITTSSVLGYGQKQSDDIVHSYTACRSMMSCSFSETETKPVLQLKKNIITKTRQVPDMDESGNSIIDIVPLLDNCGNNIMEEVIVLDESGNPQQNTIMVLDESGNQIYDDVQAKNPLTGELIFDTVPDLDASGIQRVKNVRVRKYVIVGYSDNETLIYDACGNQVMESVQARDVETNELLYQIIPIVNSEGEPVMETVQARDPSDNKLLFNTIPKVDASGQPIMKLIQSHNIDGELIFETVINLDASNNPIQEEYHMVDPSTNELLYTSEPVLNEDGTPKMEKQPKLNEQGEIMYISVQAKNEQGELLFTKEEARDPETNNLIYEPVPLLDERGNNVIVDGDIVYIMQVKMVDKPVMIDEIVKEDVPVLQMVPVMGLRDMYITRPVMEEVQDEEEVPIMITQQATNKEPIMISRQKSVKLPIYKNQFVNEEELLTKQVPVMEKIPRVLIETVTEMRIKTTSIQRMRTETYTEEEISINEDGKYIWEIKRDENGDELRIPSYEMRYVDVSGMEISKDEYDSMKSSGLDVYKCAFIGCVYICG
ncbi:DUF2793 domain-containing protein [Chlorella virus XW01]|nr:DUF2793 domain-containing protein [Chlorella virus XW01]